MRDGLAWVTLNRPAALNALDQEVMDGLLEVLDSLARDRSVRCVGLRGAGRAFANWPRNRTSTPVNCGHRSRAR
ncbi:enoyl-CoA hydratase/isomerase family protein [Rhodococcus oxybenzonivorans]|uniref:enoyl-CoA hydratase/isomerase family protein n=1 Tax=Rhodococcus oxybenzonivorans TaxID=1990687 RepID=UPI0013A59B28